MAKYAQRERKGVQQRPRTAKYRYVDTYEILRGAFADELYITIKLKIEKRSVRRQEFLFIYLTI